MHRRLDLQLHQVEEVGAASDIPRPLHLLRGLRGVAPNTRVVITTSCARSALKGESVDAFLRKPFTLDALLLAIHDALEGESA